MQDVPAYEIIIGDDSPDSCSGEVAQSFLDQGLPIIYSHWRNGLGQSRNVRALFEKSTGDICTLIHDDDKFRPEAFGRLLKPFQNNSDLAASYGRQVIVSEDDVEDLALTWNVMEAYGKGVQAKSGIVEDSLVAGALKHFPNDSYFVRADLARAIDYHDGGRSGSACDFYFGFRLGLLRKPFYFVDSFVADYCLSSDSIARSGSDSGFYQFKIMLEDLAGLVIPPVINERLRDTARLAVFSAAKIDPVLGWKWFFSRYHRHSIFTLGGGRRFAHLIAGYLQSRAASK